MKGYKTSKDYHRLKELLDKGYEVICFYTYDFISGENPDEPMIVTDICTARLCEKGCKYEHYSLGCRGTEFLRYWCRDFKYKYTFEELLKARDIEFIEPTEIEKSIEAGTPMLDASSVRE